MRLIISIFLTGMMTATAQAEVAVSGSEGFISQHHATVASNKAQVFEAMTAGLGQWWSSGHSFSGDAANMRLNKQCLCERWDNSLVHHLNTEIWIENSKVVLAGGLGPLKELGLSGTMIWSLAATDDGGTDINWKYHVYGFSQADLAALADAVDGVLAEQLGRLVKHLSTAEGG
ncbi:MAG: hypothetical protein HKP21_01820 [Xanthomonadales bacterium]|nr:hypothetical protein [Gammaproteobacteria bacterium]MBT8072422.1 hypothetical protein [Gammaproteobacteria bacterium]NNK03263.1 hypothetical protein [Xanthomonadales bacterium]NNL00067.1 hypothetical protein [Xanthomonadales bacterium]